MSEGRSGLQAPPAVEPTARLSGLGEADLLALRLAMQVLGHKAALAGRPAAARYFADLEHAVDFAMARRGVGFVLGEAPEPMLSAAAGGDERRLVADHLRLLADNDRLSATVRELCADLLATIED